MPKIHDEITCLKRGDQFERLNYHYGQLMMVRDFRDQQSYYNEKRWMMNRFGIGYGVLHGLEVKLHEKCVLISRGLAIDKYGHEIWVPSEQSIPAPEDICKKNGVVEDTCYYVYIHYQECQVEPLKLPENDCCDPETECVYSRTRETFSCKITQEAPDDDNPVITDDFDCDIDCFRYLRKPVSRIIKTHPRKEKCHWLPLATLCFRKGRWEVDNYTDRQVAYSNISLSQAMHCLINELWRVHAARYDRRSSVPLLAQTIRGLDHHDGRLTKHADIGKRLARITTDGQYIFVTEQGVKRVHVLAIEDNEPIPNLNLALHKPGWGIAFDGDYLWVTHPDARGTEKKLSRINPCTWEVTPIDIPGLRDHPHEIVFDDEYLWISHLPSKITIPHDDDMERIEDDQIEQSIPATKLLRRCECSEIYISRIDPEICALEGETKIEAEKGRAHLLPIAGMAYDGSDVWVTYDRSDMRVGVAQRISIAEPGTKYKRSIRGKKRHPHPHPHPPDLSEEIIELGGNHVEDICFDGTHMWITHHEGASKVDVRKFDKVTHTREQGAKSAVVFDGHNIWLADDPDKDVDIHRTDIFTRDYLGSYEIEDDKRQLQVVSRMCFDGRHIWVAGYKYIMNKRKIEGTIYRLLP